MTLFVGSSDQYR